jgi:hypothetical protein
MWDCCAEQGLRLRHRTPPGPGSPARLHVLAAAGRDGPQQVSRQLDQVIAAKAFGRAAAAFADAAAAARTRDLDGARRLAAEADRHLGMAERALDGLRYVPYVAPSRRKDRVGADGEDGAPPPAGPALR